MDKDYLLKIKRMNHDIVLRQVASENGKYGLTWSGYIMLPDGVPSLEIKNDDPVCVLQDILKQREDTISTTDLAWRTRQKPVQQDTEQLVNRVIIVCRFHTDGDYGFQNVDKFGLQWFADDKDEDCWCKKIFESNDPWVLTGQVMDFLQALITEGLRIPGDMIGFLKGLIQMTEDVEEWLELCWSSPALVIDEFSWETEYGNQEGTRVDIKLDRDVCRLRATDPNLQDHA